MFLPLVASKFMRIQEGDEPEIYKGNPFKYLLSLPSAHKE